MNLQGGGLGLLKITALQVTNGEQKGFTQAGSQVLWSLSSNWMHRGDNTQTEPSQVQVLYT